MYFSQYVPPQFGMNQQIPVMVVHVPQPLLPNFYPSQQQQHHQHISPTLPEQLHYQQQDTNLLSMFENTQPKKQFQESPLLMPFHSTTTNPSTKKFELLEEEANIRTISLINDQLYSHQKQPIAAYKPLSLEKNPINSPHVRIIQTTGEYSKSKSTTFSNGQQNSETQEDELQQQQETSRTSSRSDLDRKEPSIQLEKEPRSTKMHLVACQRNTTRIDDSIKSQKEELENLYSLKGYELQDKIIEELQQNPRSFNSADYNQAAFLTYSSIIHSTFFSEPDPQNNIISINNYLNKINNKTISLQTQPAQKTTGIAAFNGLKLQQKQQSFSNLFDFSEIRPNQNHRFSNPAFFPSQSNAEIPPAAECVAPNHENNTLAQDQMFLECQSLSPIPLPAETHPNKRAKNYAKASPFHNLNKLFMYNILSMFRHDNLLNLGFKHEIISELSKVILRLKISSRKPYTKDKRGYFDYFSHGHYKTMFLKITETNILELQSNEIDMRLHQLCFLVDLKNATTADITYINVIKHVIYQVFVSSLPEKSLVNDGTDSKENTRRIYSQKVYVGVKRLAAGVPIKRF